MLRNTLIALLLLVRPALAFPALWAVHGPHATVYLLGSIHVVRPGMDWEGPAIERAVSESQEFWFEIDMSSADKVGMYGTMLLNGIDLHHTISDELSPPARARLRALEGDKLDQLEHLRPWLVLAVLVAQQASAAGFNPELGVDVTLRKQALAAGKPVHGIETAAGQIRLLADMSDAEALEAIDKMLTDPPGAEADQLNQLGSLWLDGDTDGVDHLMATMMRDTSPELARRLLTDRNVVFADTVERLANGDKTAMVTVGAGHMSGDDGVPSILTRRGLRVERVR